MNNTTILYEDAVLFDFYNALKQVAGGKKITRISWGDNDWYGFMKDNNLSLHDPENRIHNWIVCAEDMRGDDWVVL